MVKLQNVRGTNDLYGEDKRKAETVIATAEKTVEKYGFEVRKVCGFGKKREMIQAQKIKNNR